MPRTHPKVFKLLEITVIALAIILVIINLLYIKAACSTRHCMIANVLVIILLIWATVFMLTVTRHSDRKK